MGAISEYVKGLGGDEEPGEAPPSVSSHVTGESDVVGKKLRFNAERSREASVDHASRVLSLQSTTGLPADFIDRNVEEVERRSKEEGFSPEDFARTSPLMAEWMSQDRFHGVVSADDSESLSYLERLVKTTTSSFGVGIRQSELGRLGYAESMGAGNEAARRRIAEIDQEISDNYGSIGSGFLETMLASAAKITGQLASSSRRAAIRGAEGTIIGAGVGLLGGPAAPATATAGGIIGLTAGVYSGYAEDSLKIEGGLAYLDMKKLRDADGKPVDEETAQAVALFVGISNAALEMLGLKALALPVKPLIRRMIGESTKDVLAQPTLRAAMLEFGKNYSIAIAGETGTEVLQEAVNILGEEIVKASSEGRFSSIVDDPAERGAAVERLIGTANEVFRGMLLVGLPGASVRFVSDTRKAKNAKQNQQFFSSLGKGVSESKVYARLPAKMREAVERLTAGGPIESVYIPVNSWETYWQGAGEDPRSVAKSVMGDTKKFDEAKESGHDVEVSMADYAAHIAPTEHNEYFSGEARLGDPDNMNAREAEEFVRATAAEVTDDAEVSSTRKIRDDVLAKLSDVGITGKTAEHYAAVYESTFKSFGQRQGVDPYELYSGYDFDVTRQLPEELAKRGAVEESDVVLDRLRSGAAPTEREISGASLSEFLRESGGLSLTDVQRQAEEAGLEDIVSGVEEQRAPFQRRLFSPQGLPLSEGAAFIAEAGYINGPSPAELLQAVYSEVIEGRPVYAKGATNQRLLQLRAEMETMGETLKALDIDVTAMSNEEIKKALRKASGTEVEGRVLFQEESIPVLKSMLTEAVIASKQEKASPQQWKNYIQKRPGLKAEEIEWSGVMEFIDGLAAEGVASIPKEVIVEHLQWNEVRVEEVQPRRAKFGSYAEFSGKNYKELLFRFPIDRNNERIIAGDTFQGHFDERMVIAHARVKDRVGVNGEKVLFVEEIQSDWHQKGRERGYRAKKETIEEFRGRFLEEKVTIERKPDGFMLTNMENGEVWSNFSTAADARDFALRELLLPQYQRYTNSWYYDIPDAPFKSGWQLLALKHLLRKAAEEGYDRIAWTTGVQQAERYYGKNVLETETLAETRLRTIRENTVEGVNISIRQSDRSVHIDGFVRGGSEPIFGWSGVPLSEFLKNEQVHEDTKEKVRSFVETQEIRFEAQPAMHWLEEVIWLDYGILPSDALVDEVMAYNRPGLMTRTAAKQKLAVSGFSVEFTTRHRAGFAGGASYVVSALNGEFENVPDARKTIVDRRQVEEVFGKAVKEMIDHFVEMSDEPGFDGLSEEGAFTIDLEDGITRDVLGEENLPAPPTEEDITRYIESVAPAPENERTGPARGLAKAYDAVLPNIIGKYVAKYAGKIEMTSLKTRESAAEQPSVAITPELRAFALGSQPLFQRSAKGPRGQITFGPNKKFTIKLLEKADPSTFLHETGHFFLEVMGDQAQAEGASAQMLADYASTLKWLGVTSRDDIKTKHHEKWARGFEKYLAEGKAPSASLRSAFAAFRAWLVSIYQQLGKLKVTLNDDVRQVMDRLLATEEEIEQAASTSDFEPMFLTAGAAGMSDVKFAAYGEDLRRANIAAKEEFQALLMSEISKEQQGAVKARRQEVAVEVIGELQQEKIYIAAWAIQKGTYPDGSPLPEGTPPLKLDKATLVKDYGEEFVKRLRRRPGLYSTEDSIDPNVAAELLGFSSGDELVMALANMVPFDEAVKTQIDQRIEAEFGSELVRSGIAATKAKEIFDGSEAREEITQAELRALRRKQRLVEPHFVAERKTQAKARAVGRAALAGIPSQRDLREMARTRMRRTTVRDINPNMYFSAMRRFNRQAMQLSTRGKYGEAAEAKHSEMINLALSIEARKAKNDAESIVRFARGFRKESARRRIGQAGGGYLAQIDSLLAKYSFASISLRELDAATSLDAWIAQKEKEGVTVDIPDEVLGLTARRLGESRHYKNLSYEELLGVRDSLKIIAHLARMDNKLLVAHRKGTLDSLAAEAAASIRENAPDGVKGIPFETRLPKDETARALKSFFAGHRKLSSIVRQMDGVIDGGIMWELLVRPLNDAGGREAVMNENTAVALKELFAVYDFSDIRHMYSQKTHIQSIGTSLSHMGRLSVAMNVGTLDNRAKLLEGFNWTPSQLQEVLDTLDERDWNFVQSIWDYLDTFWADVSAKEERVNGVAPEKVEPVEVQTSFGVYRGGYYPLKYDERKSMRAHGDKVREASKDLMRGAYTKATTRRGHTKARVEGVQRPVRLDFGVIFEHTTQVIHDLTHHEALIDINRVLNHKDVRNAILDNYGDVVYKMMSYTIQDVAAGDVPAVNQFEKAVNWLRQGTSIAMMGWSVTTSLLQPLGLSQSMVRIGPRWVGRGIARWLRGGENMENTVAWIHERSPFMKSRARTLMREISEVRNRIRLKGTLSPITDSYFWLISRGQMIADVPTWLGMYEKAMEAGNDEARSIALADQAVLDSQGGGQMKDLAQYQRGGPLFKLWTNFYSYFNVTYNLTAESLSRTQFKDPYQAGRFAVDMLLLYTLPAVLAELMQNSLRGEEEDDELWGNMARVQLGYVLGTMLGLRELSGVAQGYFGYSGPAGVRFFSAVGRTVEQTVQGKMGESFFEALNDASGILFHYPAAQIRRTVEGVVYMADGETSNPVVVLGGPPRN